MQWGKIMARTLRNLKPKAPSDAKIRVALATIAMLVPAAALAQVQAPAATAQIGISVDAPVRSVQPDGSVRFVVRVDNTGTGQPVGSRLQVTVAEGLDALSWTCAAHAGASCASMSGSGAIDQALAGLVAGGRVEYTFSGTVMGGPPPFIKILASTTPSASSRCAGGQTQPCTSALSLPTGASLSLDVNSASTVLQPGAQVSYTIAARAVGGHGSTAGSVLRSPVPRGLTNSRWTCSSSSGACPASSGSGPIEQELGDFSAGEISFRVDATVSAVPPAIVVQAAAITPPHGGSCAGPDSAAPVYSAAPCVARKALATTPRILVSRTQDYAVDSETSTSRFILENAGTNAGGSVILAHLPEGALEFSWSCRAEGATCPQANGTGAIEQAVGSWPNSGKLVYDLVIRRDPARPAGASGSFSVMPPAGATCGAAGTPPPCRAVDARPANAVLELQQQASRVGALPGQELEYTITVANRSSDITPQGVVLNVPLARGIDAIPAWTCDSANPAIACPLGSGSGPIFQKFAELAPGSRFTYTIHARVAQAPPATIDAQASLVAPAEASMGCASASGLPVPCLARTAFSTVPILALEQSANTVSLAPGGLVNFVLDIFNLGADAGVVNVGNVLPDTFAGATWVCSGLGIGCPSSSGSGSISESIAGMPEGASVRYSVSAQVDGALPETVTNVLTAASASGGRCFSDTNASLSAVPCSDRFETSLAPLIGLAQSSAERQVLRGGAVHYSVDLKNRGGAATDTRLHMAMPDGVSRLDWSCSGFNGAVCTRASGSGEIDEAVGALPAGGSLAFSINAVLAQDAPDTITSRVYADQPAGAHCDGGECSNVLTVPVTDVPSAHLQVAVQSPAPEVQSGGLALWLVDVRNLGSEIAGEFHVRHLLEDSGFEARSWTCEGAECPAVSGNGQLDQAVRSLSVYDGDGSEREVAAGRIVFRVLGVIRRQPGESATLAALVTPAAGDTCGPAACEDSIEAPVGVLGVSEITIQLQSNDFEVFPNSQVNYSFTLINTGGASVPNVTAFSVEPPEFTSISWTCTPSGGASCPTAGSGTINEVIANMPIMSAVSFQITANTGSTLPLTIDYQVGAIVPGGVLCVPASCTNTLSLPARDELTLTLDANATQVIPGGSVVYTYTLGNTGGGSIFGVDAASIEPADVVSSSWTCLASGGANCPSPSGFGPLLEPISSMPVGSSVTYTITAFFGSTLQPVIDFEVQALLGGQGNVPTGALPCNPSSCSVVLSLPRGSAIPPSYSVSKTADRSALEPGGTVRYSVVIANTGNVDGGNFQVTDAIPPGLDSFSWTCSSTGETGCSSSGGTGAIDEYIEYMGSGSSITFDVDATVSSSASGTISNIASLELNDPGICAPVNCSAESALPVGQPAALEVTKTAVPASGTPVGTGQPISWTLRASNSGGATRGNLVLTDRIPDSAINASVVPGAGVTCNTPNPQPGANLVCTIATGFTGERTVSISATVAPGATGSVTNTVNASGPDGPVCSACTVSNPIAVDVNAGIANPRAFTAGGLAGTLLDIVNMSANTAQAAVILVTPASSVQFLAPLSSGCTATPGPDGSVLVSCPNPPSTQGINCSGNGCTIATLPANAAATLFVALNPGASATVQLLVPGDSDPSDNTLVLPLGGTP